MNEKIADGFRERPKLMILSCWNANVVSVSDKGKFREVVGSVQMYIRKFVAVIGSFQSFYISEFSQI